MKLYRIFLKNLKTVSRNPSYFVVLFICPILLILAAGTMLKSSNFENIQIGMYSENQLIPLEILKPENVQNYYTLDACLTGLQNSETSACIHMFTTPQGVDTYEIYIDNTRKVVELYTKQFISDYVLQKQTQFIDEASVKISDKISLYSSSIQSSKLELLTAESELNEQEKLLVEYRTNLSTIRREFDKFKTTWLLYQSEIKTLSEKSKASKASVDSSVNQIRSRNQVILNNLNNLENFLSPRLIPADLNYVSLTIDQIENQINLMNDPLNNIEAQTSHQSIDEISSSLTELNEMVESVDQTLRKLDSDLSNAISRTQRSKERIREMNKNLDATLNDISQIEDSFKDGKTSLVYKEAFEISNNPVFLAYPLLVSIIITFTSLVLSNMFIIKQINQPSYLRDLMTPTSNLNFLLADYLINLFFVSIQVFVLFAIGIFWFSFDLSIIWPFGFILFLASSVFIFMGISIGYLLRSQSISMLVAVFTVILLFVLSDILVPSILAGVFVKFFIDLNPFVIFNRLLTELLLIKKPIFQLTPALLRLIIISSSSAIIAYCARHISRKDSLWNEIFYIIIGTVALSTLGFFASLRFL